MAASRFDSPRRIGVCGSSKLLPPPAVTFCAALGRTLAQRPVVTIVSGGTKRRAGPETNGLAADWLIVDAAVKRMKARLVHERVITVVREPGTDSEAFELGTPQRARGTTGAARRISFVRDLDALIAVCGRGGTSEEMTLALEHEVALLPVPTFKGTSAEFWRTNRRRLISALRIDEATARRWEQPVANDDKAIRALAGEMVDVLLRSVGRRCFVIMPFQASLELLRKGIERAVSSVGDEPVHLEQAGSPGNLTDQIDKGIRYCDYAIAVLDRLRPNVFYEIGLAHAQSKPTILLRRKNSKPVPFDLLSQHRYEYESVGQAFHRRLTSLINGISTRRHDEPFEESSSTPAGIARA